MEEKVTAMEVLAEGAHVNEKLNETPIKADKLATIADPSAKKVSPKVTKENEPLVEGLSAEIVLLEEPTIAEHPSVKETILVESFPAQKPPTEDVEHKDVEKAENQKEEEKKNLDVEKASKEADFLAREEELRKKEEKMEKKQGRIDKWEAQQARNEAERDEEFKKRIEAENK